MSENIFKNTLPKGTKLKSDLREYTIENVLGIGGFGITYKVSSLIMVDNVPVKTFFAIKEHFMKGCYRGQDGTTVLCASSSEEDIVESRKDFETEARRLNKLSGLSQNIVRVNEVFKYFGTVYYVMQYLDGGDMHEYIRQNGPLPESIALSLIRSVTNAVNLIHKERILHLDIKPSNILLMTSMTDGSRYPVLIDFGIAKHFTKSGKPTSAYVAKGASEGYSPIEQYADIDRFYPEMDIYALGATLFYFLTGKNPKQAFEITQQDIEEELPKNLSVRTKDAILKAMKKSRLERTHSAIDFLESLKEQYTLPIGYVLKSDNFSYRIVEVVEEYPRVIVYKASLIPETNSKSIDKETSDEGNNGTVSLKNYPSTEIVKIKKNNNKTINATYKIYELYDKKAWSRNQDGSINVNSDTIYSDEYFDMIIISEQRDQKKSFRNEIYDNYPKTEKFSTNNSHYFASRILPKLSFTDKLSAKGKTVGDSVNNIIINIQTFLKKSLKPLLYLLFGAMICFGLYYLANSLFRSCKESAKEQPTVVGKNPKAVDSTILKAVEKDVNSLSSDSVLLNNDILLQQSEKTETIKLSDDEKYLQAKSKGDNTTLVALASNGYSKAYFDVASYYFGRKKYTKAKKYAQKAVQARVNIDEAEQLLSKIENILNPPKPKQNKQTPKQQTTKQKKENNQQPKNNEPVIGFSY